MSTYFPLHLRMLFIIMFAFQVVNRQCMDILNFKVNIARHPLAHKCESKTAFLCQACPGSKELPWEQQSTIKPRLLKNAILAIVQRQANERS